MASHSEPDTFCDPQAETAPRFIVFTCRDPRTDFRLPLVDALRRRGYEIYHVWLKRRPLVSGPFAGDEMVSMSLGACLRYLRRVTSKRDRTNIYFTTTNLCFPLLILALKAICAPGVWCFDMHDDLLYASRGVARLRARISQAMLLPAFDMIVHAAPTLVELFPASHHLGNASWLGPLQRHAPRFDQVLILASFDERTDFVFLDAVAARCSDIDFAVYGQVSQDVEAAMQALRAARPNVHYHGAYVSADLVPILQRYAVMLAPYRVDDRLTRYLDPLRYYHALNSGMEVITTPLPQVEAYPDRLHIVRTPEDFEHVIGRLRTDESARRNLDGMAPITWDTRAIQLVDILETHSYRRTRVDRTAPY